MILNFRNVYLDNASTVCGPYEAKGPLSKNFDKKYTDDLYCKEKSFEKAEIRLLEDSKLRNDMISNQKKLINKYSAKSLVEYVIKYMRSLTGTSFSSLCIIPMTGI